MKTDEIEEKDTYLSNFKKIAIGLVFVSLIYPFIVNFFFSDWAKSGTFGDTYGALNAIFSGLAFAGVITTILIQKAELKLQRTEMQETRKEFLMNRTTSVLYNQLDRFEKSLNNLRITKNGTEFGGHDAISFLYSNENQVYESMFDDKKIFLIELKKSIVKQLHLYSINKPSIETFARNAYNSIEVLKRLVFKTNLEVEELNEIKNLFFDNIGFVTMDVIERISEIAKQEIDYLESHHYSNSNFDVGEMMKTNIFLEPIKDFYNLKLTKENFKEEKSKWIRSKGMHA